MPTGIPTVPGRFGAMSISSRKRASNGTGASDTGSMITAPWTPMPLCPTSTIPLSGTRRPEPGLRRIWKARTNRAPAHLGRPVQSPVRLTASYAWTRTDTTCGGGIDPRYTDEVAPHAFKTALTYQDSRWTNSLLFQAAWGRDKGWYTGNAYTWTPISTTGSTAAGAPG